MLKLLVHGSTAHLLYNRIDLLFSPAKAAHLAGMSFDQMKALLVQRGIQLRLGPSDDTEARQEVTDMQRILADRKPR
ncbi:MAG TPA: hypothetical protein VFL17_11890 [Anaerolineae bacterium]|nr:hypothetical protein [Anaerolineae bacterium]